MENEFGVDVGYGLHYLSHVLLDLLFLEVSLEL